MVRHGCPENRTARIAGLLAQEWGAKVGMNRADILAQGCHDSLVIVESINRCEYQSCGCGCLQIYGTAVSGGMGYFYLVIIYLVGPTLIVIDIEPSLFGCYFHVL